QLAPAAAHIATHLPLRHLDAVLVDQPLPDPPRRVPLLTRRLPIRDQPLVDQRPIRAQLRRRAPLRLLTRRRHGRGQRLPHRPSMHPVALRQRPDRQPLPLAITPDLLELLHSPSHPLCDLPRELRKARTVESRSDGSGAKSNGRNDYAASAMAITSSGSVTWSASALAIDSALM